MTSLDTELYKLVGINLCLLINECIKDYEKMGTQRTSKIRKPSTISYIQLEN